MSARSYSFSATRRREGLHRPAEGGPGAAGRAVESAPVARFCLTAKDHTLLEAWLGRSGLSQDLRRSIRAKLADATIVLTSDVDPDVATLNSRIRYRLGEGPPLVCLLGPSEGDGVAEPVIPLRSRLGITLLGMREGQTAPVPGRDGSMSTLRLDEVVFQPEAQRRAGRMTAAAAGRAGEKYERLAP